MIAQHKVEDGNLDSSDDLSDGSDSEAVNYKPRPCEPCSPALAVVTEASCGQAGRTQINQGAAEAAKLSQNKSTAAVSGYTQESVVSVSTLAFDLRRGGPMRSLLDSENVQVNSRLYQQPRKVSWWSAADSVPKLVQNQAPVPSSSSGYCMAEVQCCFSGSKLPSTVKVGSAAPKVN